MIVTRAADTAAVALGHDNTSHAWSCLVRRGMLYSECQSWDHLRLGPGSEYRPSGGGVEEAWYLVAGKATVLERGRSAVDVQVGDLVLWPHGAGGHLRSDHAAVELLVFRLLPRQVSDRLPRRAPRHGLRLTASRGVPTATDIGHVAYTVPSLDSAVEFFTEVLGAEVVYHDGPVEGHGDWMSRQLNVHRRARTRLAMVRLGPGLNVELFEYTAPDQNHTLPKNSDYGGHHIALHVTDITAAVAYLREQSGVEILGDIQTVKSGPITGTRWVYFLTPWGMQFELTSRPRPRAR